jgi:trimeric autotransporter adhesin
LGNLSKALGNGAVSIGNLAGSNTSAASVGNVAIGDSAGSFTSGNYNIATGLSAGNLTTGGANVATGIFAGATTMGSANVAIGNNANRNAAALSYDNTVAIGADSIASSSSTVAIGTSSNATGVAGVAIGFNTKASGYGSQVVGASSTAAGNGAIAFGNGTTTEVAPLATQTHGNIAIGSSSGVVGGVGGGTFTTATGGNSISIGTAAQATGSNSLALGANSSDGGAANVVSVGAVGATRKIINVTDGAVAAASKDAVNGGQLFTTNAAVTAAQTSANTALSQNVVLDGRVTATEGVNATQNTAITAIQVVNAAQDSRAAAIELVNVSQSGQISALQTLTSTHTAQIAALGVGLEQANGGIAASMALGGMMVVPDSNVSINFNLSTYRGQQGFAGGIVARVAPKVYISGGIAGSSVQGSTGGRIGIAFGL